MIDTVFLFLAEDIWANTTTKVVKIGHLRIRPEWIHLSPHLWDCPFLLHISSLRDRLSLQYVGFTIDQVVYHNSLHPSRKVCLISSYCLYLFASFSLRDVYLNSCHTFSATVYFDSLSPLWYCISLCFFFTISAPLHLLWGCLLYLLFLSYLHATVYICILRVSS